MALTNLESIKEFEEYIKSKEVSVVHFYADWATQCSQINQVLEEMTKSTDYKGVRFAKIAAEDLPEISLKYNITAVPTVLLIRNGVESDRVDGANPGALEAKIKQEMKRRPSYYVDTFQYQPSIATKPDDISMPEMSLEDRLKKLVNKAPCMLFMKGNPGNPRCGFSRTIITLLDGYKADYQTFDILEDNTVREGLKVFSKWPTYPQLYLNGELLGGLDIVKEMSESGELEGMLPKKAEERS